MGSGTAAAMALRAAFSGLQIKESKQKQKAYPVFLGDFLLALMHPTLVHPRKPRPLPWTSPSIAIWPRGRVRVCGD